jgi:hypothetical protein
MKKQNCKSPSKTGWGAAGILIAVLAFFFWRSFLPDMSIFPMTGRLDSKTWTGSNCPAP